ncbi:MAG: hypothetical protein K2L04_04025 [Alistipes sp.]|nr:hypothetical protein [Alistipes sp.]
MNENPMTGQVNRLIGNRLAAGCELFLPGVGSLYIQQRGARRISKREVEPPCRVVCFSPQERGASLVDEIAAAARCEQERAQSIYDCWLDHVLGENTLTIEGVGELHFRNFTPDEEFDLLLNPQGHAPVRVKSAGSRAFWVCLLAVAAALGIGYVMFVQQPALLEKFRAGTDEEYELPAAAPADSVRAEQPVDPAAPGAAGSGAVAAPENPTGGHSAAGNPAAENLGAEHRIAGTPAAGTPVAETAAPVPPADDRTPAAPAPDRLPGSAQAPASLVPGRHYVVAGVFSTPENAGRAVDQLEREDPTLQCAVYRFGSKLMVSPFSSTDPEACRRFVRANRGRWPDIWTYSAR